jgi:hypothetical protein
MIVLAVLPAFIDCTKLLETLGLVVESVTATREAPSVYLFKVLEAFSKFFKPRV